MIYPEHIVDTYRGAKNIELELEVAKDRNFYDKERVINKLNEELDAVLLAVQEEARIYAAETGADKDGSYDPDSVFDDLEEQLS